MKAETKGGIIAAVALVIAGITAMFIDNSKEAGALKLKKISPEEVEKNRCKQYEYAA